MRGLLKAACVLVPVLTSAVVLPPLVDFEPKVDAPVADHSIAFISVQSPDDFTPGALAIRLDVFPSEEACGLGNVTVDGQVLPQISGEGKGSIMTDQKSIMFASWSFHCIRVNDQPDAQLLKFVIDSIDGKAMEGVGFSALFRQTGLTEIVNIESDLSRPDYKVANPNPEGLQPLTKKISFTHRNIEHEMHELHWMKAQLRELEYLIWLKEQAIAEHASEHFKGEIKDCDSLKCLAKAVVDKARHAAHKVLHGNRHHPYDNDVEEFDHFGKPPKMPHGPRHRKFSPGNHTCGRPKHGNHTAPPHWRMPPPHHHLLPICRYPPPPHHKPHHYRPAPPGEGPPPPPHHRMHPPPPPHGDFPPQHNEMPPPPEGHHDEFPEHDEMESQHEGHHGGPENAEQDHPPHRGGLDKEHGGPPHQGFEPEATLYPVDNPEQGPHGPPHHPPFGRRPHHNGLGRVFHILKFVIIGFLFAFLITALHRRACKSKRQVDRQARREERHRRRAFRRAACKHSVSRFLARISGRRVDDHESDDYEEKQQALLASVAEDGMSTTMTEEITEFRNVADVVEEIVAAEGTRQPQSQPIPIPASETRPLMHDYEIGSQVGDGEELPAYEDNDGSEMSSVIADGFRYTPGSTEYTPTNSPAGTVSDILGPDTKQ